MSVPQLYLAALLALMALGQAFSWRTFVSAVGDYGLERPARWAAALIVGEAAAVLLLLLPATRVAGAAAALLVAAAWTALATKAFVERRRVTNCGCFGRVLRQPLRWWVLLEDAAFVALAGWVLSELVRSGAAA